MDRPLLYNASANVATTEKSEPTKRKVYAPSEDEAELGFWCRVFSCRPKCSGNIKTLITVIILFSVVSIAQVVGSYIANSLALLGDSISMGIDTLTFCGNLYAECSTSKNKVAIQLIASGVSLLALSLFTVSVMVEAIDRLYYSDKVTVDPYIVLGFSFVGLCFDIVGFLAYYYWGQDLGPSIQEDHSKDHKPTTKENGEELLPVVELVDPSADEGNINILSALMHVASDALRSITTLIEGFLILYTDLDSENTDAVASLIVSTIIVVGTIAALISWAGEVQRYFGEDAKELFSGDLKEDNPRGARYHIMTDVASNRGTIKPNPKSYPLSS
mmetsp:Transcript_9848/g.14808  ORF Transcript_9848/g.14808 Transcript_9848/m.14808 type:complete len:331 (+) Transcript_9848:74-1066(+)